MKIVKFEPGADTDDGEEAIVCRAKMLESLMDIHVMVLSGEIEGIAIAAIGKNGDVHTMFSNEPRRPESAGAFAMLGALEWLKARYLKVTIENND